MTAFHQFDAGGDEFRYPERFNGASTLDGLKHLNPRQLREDIGCAEATFGTSTGAGRPMKKRSIKIGNVGIAPVKQAAHVGIFQGIFHFWSLIDQQLRRK